MTTLLDVLLPRRAAAPPPQKAESGIGAYWMTTEPQLTSLTNNTARRMSDLQAVARSNIWIRASERSISNTFSTTPWHLEDPDDEEYDPDKPMKPAVQAIVDVLQKPYRPQPGEPVNASPRTWTDLAAITCRHMGVCGVGYWFLDGLQALSGTPNQILYINPARVTPDQASNGNLLGWWLDKDSVQGGMRLDLDEVVPFWLEPPDYGWIPTGLVETVMMQADLVRYSTRHAATITASGGRMPGVLSPPPGESMGPDQHDQLVRDIRTIADQGDSSKRMLILQGPIEHKSFAATPEQISLVDAANSLGRDPILALWQVPISQLGIGGATGLNSGESKGYDEAVFWQKAVGPRLRNFSETLQTRILDRYQTTSPVTFVVEEPEFDDEQPRYEMAAKAINIPLTNQERRDMVGLPPFGDERDEEVWLPIALTRAYPEEEPAPIPPMLAPFTGQEPPDEALPESETSTEPPVADEGKASLPVKLAKIEKRQTQAMERDVRAVLNRYAGITSSRATARHGHLSKKPSDVSAVFPEAAFERDLEKALRPHVALIAEQALASVEAQLGTGKAGLDDLLPRLLKHVGVRIRGIADVTREKVRTLIEQGISQGMGAAELGKLIEDGAAFDEYRAEMIARTETAQTLNTAAIESYREFGVSHVEAQDGDDDPECAERNGQRYTVEEALSIEDHPNGTLAWVPIVGAG